MLKKSLFLSMLLAKLWIANAQDYTINKHVANNANEKNIIIDGQYWTDPYWNGTIPIPRVHASGNIVIPTTDNTFDFAATYDTANLYIAVVVQETVPSINLPNNGWLFEDSDPSTPWDDDAVEIFIDPKNGHPIFQAIINPPKSFTDHTARLWTNSSYTKDGIQFASAFPTGIKIISSYQVEVAIPWSKLGITPASGYQFALDIAVDDDDNGGTRDGQIAWKGTANDFNSSANYGKVRLNAADYGVPYVNSNTGSPVIDGEVQHDAAYTNSPVATVTKQVINVSDNQTDVRMTWDGSYLYVGVVVWDNHAYTNTLYGDSPEIWNDDAVEIFIDPSNSKLPYFDPSLHRQILVKFTPVGTSPTVNVRGNAVGILAATKLFNSPIYLGGYSVEVAIPWTNLGITPSAGTYLGFDVQNDDDDNGGNRDSQLAWKGTVDDWQNASVWGTIMLNYTGFINGSSTAKFTSGVNSSVSTANSVVYPNPMADQLNVEFGEAASNVKLMNAEGIVFVNENVEGRSNFSLSTLDLSTGLYIISITNQDGKVETIKVVK
jgi:hypothetical protein